MRRSIIIIIWGILLLIKQGSIIGAEKPVRYRILEEGYTSSGIKTIVAEQTIHKKEKWPHIIINQVNITEAKNVEAIVSHNNTIEIGLGQFEPKPTLTKKINELIKKKPFEQVFVIEAPCILKQRGVKLIIRVFGPTGVDREWRSELKKIYMSILDKAKNIVESVIISPIVSGVSSRNAEGKVVVTPTEEAKIAVEALSEFILKNPQSLLRKIYFTSRIEDGSVHFLAYKKALGLPLTDKEEKALAESEREYIKKWEKPKRYTDFFRKIKPWQGHPNLLS